jgi:hypothetical protein
VDGLAGAGDGAADGAQRDGVGDAVGVQATAGPVRGGPPSGVMVMSASMTRT